LDETFFKLAHNGGLAKHRDKHKLLSDKDCFVNPTILDDKAKLFADIQVIQRATDTASTARSLRLSATP
jgi:hypothetical protein